MLCARLQVGGGFYAYLYHDSPAVNSVFKTLSSGHQHIMLQGGCRIAVHLNYITSFEKIYKISHFL